MVRSEVSQKSKGIWNIASGQKPNEELSLDFAGPFQNAPQGKKYMLVSVDINSAWPVALFLSNPTIKEI